MNVEKIIASALVAHMSNAKWLKLFDILSCSSLKVTRLNYKFIGDSRIFSCWGVPKKENLRDDRFGDIRPYPYGKYQAIEWIEVPRFYPNPQADTKRPLANLTHNLSVIEEVISKRGSFKMELKDSGLRIIGYSWIKQTNRSNH